MPETSVFNFLPTTRETNCSGMGISIRSPSSCSGSGIVTFISEDLDAVISAATDSFDSHTLTPSHLSMATATTLPKACIWHRSLLTSSTAEMTSWTITLTFSQLSICTDFTLLGICTVVLRQLRMQTKCFMVASSMTTRSPSKFSTIQLTSFCSSFFGSPFGPRLLKPPRRAGGALALAAGTTWGPSFAWFLVFMSAVTFLSWEVLNPPIALKTADMPAPAGAALAVSLSWRSFARSSSGMAAKPPLGGGGPLPLPFALPCGAALPPLPPLPNGLAIKYSIATWPLTFQVTPSLQVSVHHSFKAFSDSFTALIQFVSFSTFFCITFIAWKSKVSKTL
mmetsp:Transcript_85448/g.204771  ORF Transcript_85448/g.204771 Transcript_85448/m.204771 type:complete len:337 (+) Transcript_85448:28-1038(+)